jgi:hypothetical protein
MATLTMLVSSTDMKAPMISTESGQIHPWPRACVEAPVMVATAISLT